jgi:ATP-dependent DNA helicase RecG
LPIKSLEANTLASIKATVVSAKNIFTRGGKQIQKATFADESGQIEATWFNQKFLVDALNKNPEVYVSGKVDVFNGKLVFTSPEYEPVRGRPPIHTAGLIPKYPETYGVSSKWLRSRIAPLLSTLDTLSIEDYLPQSVVSEENFAPLSKALVGIHFPKNAEILEKAKERLAFDELFLLQLASCIRKNEWNSKKNSYTMKATLKSLADIIAKLPFTLTQAQQNALADILKDFNGKTPMNRLVQGDVGSGKTIVAALAMLVTHQHGHKSIVMAPTEILATQHFATIQKFLQDYNVKVELITSSTKKSVKTNLSQSDATIFVGTHALLHRQLPEDIALVVVDEQHRFGVEQRAKLLQFTKTPHLLSMTATPIPRTIALSMYGELDLSIIDEMPVGRIPVKTWVVSDEKRARAYSWIKDEIRTKKIQAFVVCPLIDESEDEKLSEVKAVKAEYDRLKNDIFPNLNLSLLHGKLKSSEKQQIIENFQAHKSNILVSTPVIEVGIDIKNANIMVIEGAERFGLSQLHQLRGRVGRGEQESYCLLFTSSPKGESLERLKAMEKYYSGFKLAEIDLELRGPGEIYGLQQHGFSRLKIASFADRALVAKSHKHATLLTNRNPTLTNHPLLKEMVSKLMETKAIEPN